MHEGDARQSAPIFRGWIEDAIDGNGLLQYFHHDLAYTQSTPSYAVTVKRFNEYLDIIQSFSDQVWIATLGDAIRYHREAKCASLQEVEAPDGQSWTVKLTHTLPDKELFDYPLTLLLKMNGVDYQKITQDGKQLDFTTFNDTIMFKAIPNGENILLETKATGIASISNSSEPRVVVSQNTISVTSSEVIKTIEVYSVSGVLVKSIQSGQTSYPIPTDNLMQGVYIVKVTTETSQKNVKVIVR